MTDDQLAKLRRARNHLSAALGQALPTDDQIIVGHMREALDQIEQIIQARAPSIPVLISNLVAAE